MKQLVKKNIKASDKKIIVADKTRVFILDYVDRLSAVSTLPIFIGRESQVQYVFILDHNLSSSLKINREIHIADRAKVDSYQVYFGRGDYQVNINNHLGKNVILNSQGLFWPKKQQILQVQDNDIFTARSAVGKFKVIGLVDDSASAQYYANVTLKPEAQLSEARIDLSLHLLSSTARGRLLPGLKIAANDVKAGHSASTFHLAPEDLFYLQTRGLSPAKIKVLVINSIAGQFVSGIKDETTKNLILKLIKKRSD
ncbi:MAG: SufD family Fe-S cluster assembly protein [Patescibacteria group bacterium]|jgi:Fe-S cluster assembly protein SufD